MPMQLLIVAGTFVVVIAVLLTAISLQDVYVLLLLAVFPIAVFFAVNPEIWLVMIIAFYQSGFRLPSLPSNASVFEVLSIFFSGFMLFYAVLKGRRIRRPSPVRKWVILFAMVLAGVILVRGIGIRYFGSTLWGGSYYILLIATVALYFFSDYITMPVKFWNRAIAGMFVLSFFPLVAQLIFTLSGGAIWQQYFLVQPLGFVAGLSESAMEDDASLVRFQSDGGIFLMMIPLLFARPFQSGRLIMTIMCWVVALATTSFTGYRSGIITAVLIPAAWMFWGDKKINLKRSLLFGFCAVFLLSVAALNARHFPLSVQRSLTFIPFADVSEEVFRDADATSAWRLGVWHRAIVEVLPNYWLVGQGLAFNPRDLQEIITLGLYNRDWAFVTRSYHNGPLSLLLILGLPGAIAGFGFMFAAIREYYRNLRAEWHDETAFRIYRVSFAWLSVLFFNFCTIYGDLQVSFPRFFFVAMLLEGMAKTRERMSRDAKATDGEAGQEALPDVHEHAPRYKRII